MRFSSVLNVIAQDAGPLAARLASFGEIAWLAERRAFDIGFDGNPTGVLSAALAAAGDLAAEADINVVATAGRKKKLLVSDMESTIISCECLDELAALAGIGPKIAAITARAMKGEIEFEGALRECLGVTNVGWLAGGPAGDDTHGHIDDICRFVDARTVVLIRERNSADINYRPLAENWERIQDVRLEDGSKPEVVALPMPAPLYFDGCRLPASYANFYISNAAAIVPTFNDPNDRVALGILGELFRGRPVVGIHCVDMILGFGSLHCLSQQQPAE